MNKTVVAVIAVVVALFSGLLVVSASKIDVPEVNRNNEGSTAVTSSVEGAVNPPVETSVKLSPVETSVTIE